MTTTITLDDNDFLMLGLGHLSDAEKLELEAEAMRHMQQRIEARKAYYAQQRMEELLDEMEHHRWGIIRDLFAGALLFGALMSCLTAAALWFL